MKDYREVADNVFRRSEEIIAEKRRRKKTTVKLCSAAGCFCLTALIGFGAWQSGEGRRPPVISAEQSNSSAGNSGPSSETANYFFIGIPDNGDSGSSYFDPNRCGVTMVSSYPGAGAACYATPESGKAGYSAPLSGAMNEYGESVLYRVVAEVFCNQEQLDPNSEELKAEMERLSKLGYIVAFETYNDGSSEHYYFTLHAKYDQLKNFAVKDEYSYFFFLYDEYV